MLTRCGTFYILYDPFGDTCPAENDTDDARRPRIAFGERRRFRLGRHPPALGKRRLDHVQGREDYTAVSMKLVSFISGARPEAITMAQAAMNEAI